MATDRFEVRLKILDKDSLKALDVTRKVIEEATKHLKEAEKLMKLNLKYLLKQFKQRSNKRIHKEINR